MEVQGMNTKTREKNEGRLNSQRIISLGFTKEPKYESDNNPKCKEEEPH